MVVEAATGGVLAALVLVAVYPDLFTTAAAPGAARRSSRRASGTATAPTTSTSRSTSSPSSPCSSRAFAVLGLVAAYRLVRHRWRVEPAQAVRLALVTAQLAALPLVAVARNSELYNGLRQLLFAVPAWAVLVTVGLAHALAWARRARPGPGGRGGGGWPPWCSRWSTRPRFPLPVLVLQRGARRDRRGRAVRLLAHERPRAAAGHPHGRPGRLRAHEVEPAGRHRRQPRGRRCRRHRDAGRPVLVGQQRRLPDRPARAAVARVGGRRPAPGRRPAARRVLRRHRPGPRHARQLHAAGPGEPRAALAHGVDELRRPLPARAAAPGRDGRVHPAPRREHGPAAVGLRPRGVDGLRLHRRHRRGVRRGEPDLRPAGRLCRRVLARARRGRAGRPRGRPSNDRRCRPGRPTGPRQRAPCRRASTTPG